jgi:GT2 family glycosyltransferase
VNTLPPVNGAGHAERSSAAVVMAVVSWNTRDLLDRCLRSFEPHVEAGLAEVWVVDNGSSDGSVEMVRDRHGWARLVESGENLGYGRAVNLVAERTSSPWFVLSNADIALRPGALEALLEAGQSDVGAGIVAPRLILPGGRTQQSVWAFPTIAATAVQNAGPRIAGRRLAERLALAGHWDANRARRVPWAVGAFLLVRREAWDATGGFDPGQWMSAEDLDLGWRMRAAGWATRYEPRAVVDHEESAATGQVWGSDLPIHWQRCAYAWMYRRMGRGRTAAVGALNFVGSGGRYLLLLLRGQRDEGLRALGRWTLVHAYALAPRRVLERYR